MADDVRHLNQCHGHKPLRRFETGTPRDSPKDPAAFLVLSFGEARGVTGTPRDAPKVGPRALQDDSEWLAQTLPTFVATALARGPLQADKKWNVYTTAVRSPTLC